MTATYDTLIADVAAYLHRRDLTAVIPTFISSFENEVNRVVRTRDMVIDAFYDYDPADYLPVDGQDDVTPMREGVISLPGDFLQPFQFETVSDWPIALKPLTQQRADEIRVRRRGLLSMYYDILGTQMEIVPHPPQPIRLRLAYYARLQPLAPTNQTNWFLNQHYDLYLFGSLAQSAPYLDDDARIETWRGFVNKGFQDLQVQTDKAVYGQSSLVSRPKASFG